MHATVHAQFASVVATNPGTTALLWQGQHISYRELDERASWIASALIHQVRAGARVGLFCQRSPDTVAAILGVLKLGATYVPFDLSYPRAQLALMLEDAQPELIVYDEAGASVAQTLKAPDTTNTTNIPQIKLESLTRQPLQPTAAEPVSLPERGTSADLAYVMFTSGSHGRPKGVMVRHRGILRLVLNQTYARFSSDEVFLHMAPLAFDASTFELWGALLHGGTVAILSNPRPALAEIAETIRTHHVTTAWMTAGLFHAMADRLDRHSSDLATLRQLLAGGDVLSPEHVKRVLRELPQVRLINGYGPTENTTFTCCYTVPPQGAGAGSVPIGAAIHGTTLYILDDQLQPVPEGTEGQLVVGGAGVAAGYLGRPELTAERFIPDRFAHPQSEVDTDVPAMLYLTGDKVRVREDGQLVFLGRIDRQLKIDGKRIELDEIEAALRQCTGIADAAVVVRQDSAGVKRIVAYVTTKAAYVSRAHEHEHSTHAAVIACKRELIARLPQHMLPSLYAVLPELPLNAQGKLDRARLPEVREAPTPHAAASRDPLEREIMQAFQAVLGGSTLDPEHNIFDLGGTSLHVVRIHALLTERYPSLELVTLFEKSSVRALARHLSALGSQTPSERSVSDACEQARQEGAQAQRPATAACAIVGIAGRVPGAADIETFFQNICQGVDSISHFSEDELEDAFPREVRADEDFVRARGVLPDIEQFDAEFFHVSPREATLMDPQHRVFLECAWEAFEDAGYDHSTYNGRVGVFAGCSLSTYLLRHVLSDRERALTFASEYQVGMYPELLGALTDTLATRVAYKLNLKGPAATVHTACSTSAFAIAQACQSLLLYQCDMALAGGVSITHPQRRGYMYSEGGMVSRDGTCRPFDAAASGTVFGSGAGAILLKRLEDAIADGDHIYAVVRGVGVNNDGSDKAGFTAPSAQGQAAAILAAQRAAGVAAASIGYMEAHGTATPLGDPIEFSGLVSAFSRSNAGSEAPEPRSGSCALGSVKANIGHVDAAAGVLAVIKTALCLEHGVIPPLAHFERPNPALDLASSPFYVPTQCSPWRRSAPQAPRRAGVSSFGVGGTNVHLVLEEAPLSTAAADAGELDAAAANTINAAAADAQPSAVHILPLSARTGSALAQQAAALAEHLSRHPELALADVAFTLQRGRRQFEQRCAVVVRTPNEAIEHLRARAQDTTRNVISNVRPDAAVFMFPGQGAQFAGMGRELYESSPTFRHHIDHGAALALPRLGFDLRERLFAAPSERANAALADTLVAQPALFVTSYALAQLWMQLGVTPSAMVGHSVGEFTAAALAQTLTYEEALDFLITRAETMQHMPPGAMLAVRLPVEQLQQRLTVLGTDLDIAAVNAPNACVVAGPHAAIARLSEALAREAVAHKQLATSHAFHSALVAQAATQLLPAAASLSYRTPRIPYVSCVTARWIDAHAADIGPDYVAEHCRKTVRFADALTTACQGSRPLLIEVGPGQALRGFAKQTLGKAGYALALAGLQEGSDAQHSFAQAAADVWASGWPTAFGELASQGRRVSLPTYPFERSRHWLNLQTDPDTEVLAAMSPQPSSTSRVPELQQKLAGILQNVAGAELSSQDFETNFLELGFDSLALGQVSTKIQQQFKIKIGFRQLMSEYPSCAALAVFLDSKLPASAPSAQPAQTIQAQPPALAQAAQAGSGAHASNGVTAHAASAPVTQSGALPSSPASQDALSAIFQAQLRTLQDVISQQNQVLTGLPLTAASQPAAPLTAAPQIAQPPAAATAAAVQPQTPTPDAPATSSRYRQFDPKSAAQNRDTDAHVRAFIEDLSRRWVAKTKSSRESTERNRPQLADPRAAAGFRPEWKELCYPIVSARSKGSKLWDLDGHEYIDLVNGYGQTMFGHAPNFVQQAVTAQLAEGFAIGPQSPLAGEVAQLICEFVGLPRVTFCNTGSEAVMAAMRVARAVTGREKVAVFANDYHGQFDEVLVRGRALAHNAEPNALPIAPGIPNSSVANMLVLPYGSDESLAYLKAHMDELAAVIVEPVQSRHPELRPYAFLRELRAATEQAGAALVFDEVVTGFRVHPGGMQAVTGIRADMATYGKVLGGGMPVGILAGSTQFMDALDGGQWRFGDDSYPEVAPTFFAGTFVRHPLVLAACKAVLLHLREAGPALQMQLTQRTEQLVARLNDDLRKKGVPSLLETFSSWFMPNFGSADPLGALFYHHMRLLGIHVQDGFPCFLTTAHSDSDLEAISSAFASSIDAVQRVGILAPTPNSRAHTEEATTSVAAPAPVPPIALEREIDLSEPQTEILMSAQLGPEASACFNESVSVRLVGAPDAELLRASLNSVLARHEALRAHVVPNAARLHIAAELTLALSVVDLQEAADPESALAEQLDLDARTPFDLHTGPLVRAHLFVLSPEQHVLVFTAHHIVCDGWSMNVILTELAAQYSARVRQHSAEVDPVKSFSEYAAEQSQAHKADASAEQYWLTQYQTLPAPLNLPTDRAYPLERTFAGATYTTFIDAQLTRELRKAGAKRGSTLFSTLLASMQMLMGRLSGQADIVVACPFAGQSEVEDRALVGHCVHLLPIRTELTFEASLGEHIERTHHKLLGALEHQAFTFGTLVRKLKLPANASRVPLTSLQFNLERLADRLSLGGIEGRVSPNPKAFANFDLFWNVAESPDGLRIDCDYNGDVLDRSTVARWLESYRALLHEVARDATTPLAQARILSETEQHALLYTWNQSARDFPLDKRISDLFAEQAARAPDAIAVSDDTTELSYSQLERKANQLARLIDRKLPQNARVAVALPRSHQLLVTLLASMKAGRTYVPVDLDHPPSRLRQVLELADVSAILCAADLLGAIAPSGVQRIRVDEASYAREDAGPFSVRASQTPAYIIFTSGSTGVPKGVAVGHPALTNCLLSVAERPGFGPTHSLVSVATVAFDIAAAELYLPLICGGRVHIATRDEVQSGFPLLARVQALHATHLQCTPTLWRILLEAGFRSHAGFHMWSTGEPLPRDVADALLAGGGELWNLYGPTETTIWASLTQVQPSPSAISIGEPIANAQLHVLDAYGQLCPVGVVGELYIAGACLAEEYFRRPDLTEQAFVQRTLPDGQTRRLYRTGDSTRRLADGTLQMLGRRDQQIKLHGFRVELEEIELTLRGLPHVQAAAVALNTTAQGQERLVAYVVPARGQTLTAEALREALSTKLPHYMVPTAWITLTALPETANGKLDRKALPEPTHTEAAVPESRPVETAAPRSPIETSLHEIWSEVLQVRSFGVDAKLFSLGADSLHIFRIVARMTEQGFEVSARDLMRNPTVAQLAKQLSTPRSAPRASGRTVPSLDNYRRNREASTGRS